MDYFERMPRNKRKKSNQKKALYVQPVRDNPDRFDPDPFTPKSTPKLNGRNKRKGTPMERRKGSKILKPNGYHESNGHHKSNGHHQTNGYHKSNGHHLKSLNHSSLSNGKSNGYGRANGYLPYIADHLSTASEDSIPNSATFNGRHRSFDQSTIRSNRTMSRLSRMGSAKSDDRRTIDSTLSRRSKSRSPSPDDNHLSQDSQLSEVSDKMCETQDQLAMMAVNPPNRSKSKSKKLRRSNRSATSMNGSAHSMNGSSLPMNGSNDNLKSKSKFNHRHQSTSKPLASSQSKQSPVSVGSVLEFRDFAQSAYIEDKSKKMKQNRKNGTLPYSSLGGIPMTASSKKPLRTYGNLSSKKTKRKSRRVWGTGHGKNLRQSRAAQKLRIWPSVLSRLPGPNQPLMKRNGKMKQDEIDVFDMKKEEYKSILREKSMQVQQHLGSDLADFVDSTPNRSKQKKDISNIDLTEDMEDDKYDDDDDIEILNKKVNDFIGNDDQSDIEILNGSHSSLRFTANKSFLESRSKFDRENEDDVMDSQRFEQSYDSTLFRRQKILKELQERQRIAEEEKEAARRQKELEELERQKAVGADRETAKFDALSEEDEEHINDIMELGMNAVVSRHKMSNLEVRVRDLSTLEPGKWLNDEVMNFYISLLQDRTNQRVASDPEHCRVLFMNTFFFTKLRTSGHKSVKRWTKKVKLKKKGLGDVNTIFELDKVIFPVHVNGVHWCCGCINLKEKRLEYYDSMSGSAYSFFNKTREYLKAEITDKLKGEEQSNWLETLDEWEQDDNRGECPQQENGFDCGVFSSKCADWISDDLVPNYGQEDMHYFRRRMMLEIARGKTLD